MLLTATPYRVRSARATDRAGLAAMLTRCSAETRLRRFHGNLRTFPALASCRSVDAHTAELAVLVEDAHQGRGLGGCLLRSLVDRADRGGITTLRASLLTGQGRLVRLLRQYGDCGIEWSAGVVDVTVRRTGPWR